MGIIKDIIGIFSKKVRLQSQIDHITKRIEKLDAKISRGGAPATIARMRNERLNLVAERAQLMTQLG